MFSRRRPTVRTPSPADRRLRTQLTSPKVPMTHVLPPTLTLATGVVLSTPEFRPRTLSRALGPSGTPSLIRRRAIGLKIGTKDGTRGLRWFEAECGTVVAVSSFVVMRASSGSTNQVIDPEHSTINQSV